MWQNIVATCSYGCVTLEERSLICKITGSARCFLGLLSCNPPTFLKAVLALTCRNVGEKPFLLGGAGLSPINHSVSWLGALFSGAGMRLGSTLGQAP